MKRLAAFLLALLYATAALGQNSVQSFSFDGTGLTPSTPQFGFIVVGGALNATHGGTGQTGYAIGNLLYASSPTALAKLPIGTNGYVLTVSGGLPTWMPGGSGSGSVTSVSVVTANGFAGTVATATSTPAITVSALGTKTIVKRASTAVASGDMVSGGYYLFVYDGTNMQVINPTVNFFFCFVAYRRRRRPANDNGEINEKIAA